MMSGVHSCSTMNLILYVFVVDLVWKILPWLSLLLYEFDRSLIRVGYLPFPGLILFLRRFLLLVILLNRLVFGGGKVSRRRPKDPRNREIWANAMREKILGRLHCSYTVIRTSTGGKDFQYQFREATHMLSPDGDSSASSLRTTEALSASPVRTTAALALCACGRQQRYTWRIQNIIFLNEEKL